jgi:Bacterial PH domain
MQIKDQQTHSPRLQYPRLVAGPGTTLFRSRSQVYALIGFGLLIVLLGLLGAAQDTATSARVGDGAAALILGLACVAVAIRAALLAGDDGITIRNPFGRTLRIPWTEIAGFTIGRYKLLGAVCLVELHDGSTVHAWAIQIPRASRKPAASREAMMIEELNRLLASRRSTLA